MKIVKGIERRCAFVLRPPDLDRLVQSLGGDDGVLRILVDFADGSTAVFEHVGEVAELRNTGGRRIEAVAVEHMPRSIPWQAKDSPPRYAWVRLRSGRGDSIRWHVSGEERDVLSLSAEFDAWVASLVPWYGRLAVLDGAAFLFLSLLAAASVSAIALALQATVPVIPAIASALEASLRPAALRLLPALGVVLPLASVAALVLARARLFPVGTFAIGYEEGRERSVETLRRSVSWASAACAVLGLAAGLASGLVS